MTKRPANSVRAFFRASLLSFLLLWCTGFALLPGRAAADTAPLSHFHCVACDPASRAPHHTASVFCNVLPHAVKDDPTTSLDSSLDPAAPHSVVVFERVDFALPLATTRRPFAAPPLYLSLQRLLN